MRGDYSDSTIVMPTLNEEENIGRIIAVITRMYPRISVIVSDDGSKDSTKRIVKGISAKNKRVRFFDRSAKKAHGNTTSVIDALPTVSTPKVIVMDADFQHPVKKVGEMLDALDESDIVVGVRRGPGKRSFSRRFLSKGLIYLSLMVFKLRGFPTCGDMASGFIGFKTSMIKKVISKNRDGYVGTGNKVLLDTLRMVDKNTKIAEVYYPNFPERERGKSKMSYKIIFLSLESVFR
ncbi:MAG TPA: glycosyltransferase [Candidatus Acidoferrum sp.]|nr:glycosyltransferase [Candidatus Acidoferrum sp.]